MRQDLTCRIKKAAAAEIGTKTWDRPGGKNSRADSEVMDRTALMDMATITAGDKVAGMESMAAGTEDRTETTSETGGCMVVKSTPTTPPTPQYGQKQQCIYQDHRNGIR